MKKTFFTLVILIWTFHLTQAQYAATETKVENLNAGAFLQKLQKTKNPVLVDIRTLREYQAGHLQGAIQVDFYNPRFVELFQKAVPDKNRPVFIYCRSGHRSGIAVNKLKAAGYRHIINLSRGIIEWVQAGYPMVR